MVVAVPLPVGVERHQEQVRARQRLEHLRRAACVEHRVAERARQPLQNSGPRQETELVPGQVREQLRLQVVGHEPVAPGERGRAVAPALRLARFERQRGEVETRGPALGVRGQLGDLLGGQVDSGRAQQLVRLRLVHPQLVRPDLDRQAARPEGSQLECGLRRARRGPAAIPREHVSRVPRRRLAAAGLSMRCRSSKAKTTCWSIVARAAPRRGTTLPSTDTPGDASASNTLWSSRETRSSAAATYVSRTIGSLSRSSRSTHANGRFEVAAH